MGISIVLQSETSTQNFVQPFLIPVYKFGRDKYSRSNAKNYWDRIGEEKCTQEYRWRTPGGLQFITSTFGNPSISLRDILALPAPHSFSCLKYRTDPKATSPTGLKCEYLGLDGVFRFEWEESDGTCHKVEGMSEWCRQEVGYRFVRDTCNFTSGVEGHCVLLLHDSFLHQSDDSKACESWILIFGSLSWSFDPDDEYILTLLVQKHELSHLFQQSSRTHPYPVYGMPGKIRKTIQKIKKEWHSEFKDSTNVEALLPEYT